MRNDTKIIVSIGGDKIVSTWGEFVRDNSDSMDADELQLIASDLHKFNAVQVCAGAAGDWSIHVQQ
jgi:hypothetical protein